MTSRYSGDRVRRGLWHFMLGKGVSAGCSFLAMVLVVRALSLPDFADYSVLVALIDLGSAFSGLGLAHVMVRYVPELYERQYRLSLRRLVGGALGVRTVAVLLLALLAHAWASSFSGLIGIHSGAAVLSAFLVIVVLRSTAHFLSQVLESTLNQGLVQVGFSLSAAMRLVGMALLLQRGDVRLIDVIYVEAIADAASILVIGAGVLKVLFEPATATAAAPAQDAFWLRARLRTIARFAAAGYLQHLAILPYGAATNRLVAGHMLAASAVASLGFAQSLAESIKRYLPALLLVGLIRPVIVARWTRERNFAAVAEMCRQVVLVNVVFIAWTVCVLAVSGTEILQALSAGKYGVEALWVLFGLCAVLLLETHRVQLEVLVQTVERYEYLIPSNALVASSVVGAIALLPALGVIAFPVANGIGLLMGNHWVQRRMRGAGFDYRNDWLGTGLAVACSLAAAVAAGALARLAALHWMLAAALAAAMYAVLAWVFLGAKMRSFYEDFTGRAAAAMPVLPEEPEGPILRPIRIAFGVLSSRKAAGAIDEIARAVAPHRVIVHHDFSKEADFRPHEPNVTVLPEPASTAWGDWSLVRATQRLMREALADPHVTHFQLLSETCLPVRPIEEFEDYLRCERPDVMIDMRPLDDRQALYSHAWRYLSGPGWSRRIARMATVWTWQHAQHLQTHNINLQLPGRADTVRGRAQQWIGRQLLHAFAWGHRNGLRNKGALSLAIGSQWMGYSRRAMSWLLEMEAAFPLLTRHFQQTHIPDEAYVHTLVSSGVAAGVPLVVRAGNHVLFWDECGTGPDLLGTRDFARVQNSGRHFARKFPLDAQSPVRSSFLQPLATSLGQR